MLNNYKHQLCIVVKECCTVVRCRLWGETIAGWDCGDAAAAWFSQYLKEDHRLVYNPGVQLRTMNKTHLYMNAAKNDDKVRYQLLSK